MSDIRTPQQLIAVLKQYEDPGLLTLSPGPIRLRVGKHDFKAARVIERVLELYDDSMTIDDLVETLLAALWWAQFVICIEQKQE